MIYAVVDWSNLSLESVKSITIVTGIVYAILYIIRLIGSTCDTIIRVLLLYYAMTGKMPEELQTVDIAKISERT